MMKSVARYVLSLLLGLVPAFALAAPTDFDPTFNGGAHLRIADDMLSGAAFPDGGIAVLSYNRVIRVDSGGRLDSAFTPIMPVPGATLAAVAVNANGTIGTVQSDSNRYPFLDAYIGRYQATGAPDASFGGTGSVKLPTFFRGGPAGQLLLDAAGRAYIVAGTAHLSVITQEVRRIGPDSTDSLVLHSAQGVGADALIYRGMSFASDGALLVATTSGASELGVSRITAVGPDASFGVGGIARASVVGDAFATHAIQGPGGTVLVVGTAGRGGVRQAVVARFLSSGVLDVTFGQGGLAFVEAARLGEGIYDPVIALQPDGRIVVAGTLHVEPRGGRPFPRILVARLTSDGNPDNRFAPAGFTTYWWEHGTEFVYLDVRPNGGIVLGGSVYTSVPTGSAVSRGGVVFRLQGGEDAVARPLAEREAVEYFHAGYGHYFLSADAQEIASLDTSPATGWARTGRTMRVWDDDDPTLKAMCRFWSDQSFAPKSSHFYTPYDEECTSVKNDPSWYFERNAFKVRLPEGPLGARICVAGSQPLYRAYNNGQGGAPNHRYMTDPRLLDEMIARGWTREGEAQTRIFACVPVE